MKKSKVAGFLCILFLAVNMSFSRQTSLSIYNVVGVGIISTNSVVMQEIAGITGNTNIYNAYGNFIAHLNITPSFSFEQNFQADGILDVFLSRSYSTNDLSIMIRQANIDFLFWETFSINTGFLKVDYGFNSYFHPLNINGFFPEFIEIYDRISVATEEKGFEGVPAIRAKVAFSDLFGKRLNIAFEQSLIWYDFSNFERNFHFSYLSFVYMSVNFGLIAAYSEEKKPVWGGNFSTLLPGSIMFFVETLYRTESFRPYVNNDLNMVSQKEDGDYFNVSVRLEWSKPDPVLKNPVDLKFEYFYFAEGFNGDEFYNLAEYCEGPLNLISGKYNDLIIRNRNFRHYIYGFFGYTITGWKLSFNYELIASLDVPSFQHNFSITKAYNNAALTLGTVYNSSSDETVFEIVNYGMKWNVFLNFMLVI